MRIENHLSFKEDLINRLSYKLWMHSPKCRYIRIGFYIAMLLSTILMGIGLLRTLVIKTDLTMMLTFLLVDVALFVVILLIWPLAYRSQTVALIKNSPDQIVTMDERLISVHTKTGHKQYKCNHFNDYDEDDMYYYLFSPEDYVVLDKTRFNRGGRDAFLNHRAVMRLVKNASRKSPKARYLILLDKDYLTPIAKIIGKKESK